MHTCCRCREPAALDDLILSRADGRCLCLRCDSRETGAAPVLPASLRHALDAVLAAAEPPHSPASPFRSDAPAVGTTDDERPLGWWTPWWDCLEGSL